MRSILIVSFALLSSFASAQAVDYSKCQKAVNARLGEMTDAINPAAPNNLDQLPLQMQKDGTLKLDLLPQRKGKLVRDGKNGTLTVPSYFMDQASGKVSTVTTTIQVTYDSKDRIEQFEERPSMEKRVALGKLLNPNGLPLNEATFGTRLYYGSGGCEVDQTYMNFIGAGGKLNEVVNYDRQACKDLKPALAKLDRASLDKCSTLMSEMAQALNARQKAMAKQGKDFMTLNFGVKVPQNPFMFTLTTALSCRAMDSANPYPDFTIEKLDVDDKGSSSDDSGVAK